MPINLQLQGTEVSMGKSPEGHTILRFTDLASGIMVSVGYTPEQWEAFVNGITSFGSGVHVASPSDVARLPKLEH